MSDEKITEAVETGKATAAASRMLREALRWRVSPDDPDRQEQIDGQLADIDRAMRPIRSHVGRLVWEPIPEALEASLREASRALQYERRQLKKMQR